VAFHDCFDDHALLFQPLYADTIGLTPTARAIWRALDGSRTLAEVADLLHARFHILPEEAAQDVCAFVTELARRGFVTSGSLRSISRPAPFSVRNAECRPSDLGKTGGMKTSVRHHPIGFSLAFADGSRFLIRAGDSEAAGFLDQFAAAAGLSPCSSPGKSPIQRVLVVTHEPISAPDNDAVCLLQAKETRQKKRRVGRGRGMSPPKPGRPQEWLWKQLIRLSAFLGANVQANGGVLLHGALLSFPIPPSASPDPRRKCSPGTKTSRDSGILLVGRSGVGKTTACARLTPPWRALSDDMALVVRAPGGAYWAHPWPTWSRLFDGQPCKNGDMRNGIPLQAIFIIDQAARDRVKAVGRGEGVCMLMEAARQAGRYLWEGIGPDEISVFHRQRFDNLSDLVRTVPVHLLDVSRKGAFWKEMERVLYP
jgi:hypothetical protein